MKQTINGIILAAGLSSRAKTNKMLFSVQGKYLIQHTIDGMRPFVNQIYVVTGKYDKELREALKDNKDLKYIYNANFMNGMYSSILCGLSHTDGDILLLPGDVAYVQPETYKKLLNTDGEFIVPSFNGQTGHPILIKQELRQDILNHPNYSRMRDYRNDHGFTTVEVDDIFVTLDVDNEDDLNNLKRILKERN